MTKSPAIAQNHKVSKVARLADSGVKIGWELAAFGKQFGGLDLDVRRDRTQRNSEIFDRQFDEGKDVGCWVDWSKARRPNTEIKRVNVDFPMWVVEGLDNQARHLGVTRQALIKMWIAERLG